MKNFIGIVLFFSLSFNVLFAGDPYFRAKLGDQAILFNLDLDNGLTAGNFGGGLGYQYYFAKHAAFRFGLGGKYLNESIKEDGNTFDSSYTSFSLMPAIRFNTASSSNILAYVGAQGLVELSKNKLEGIEFSEDNSTENRTVFGFGAIIGAEWFPWDNVSLSAEYGLMFKSSSGTKEYTIEGHTESADLPKTTEIGLGASSLNFTLSFFFN